MPFFLTRFCQHQRQLVHNIAHKLRWAWAHIQPPLKTVYFQWIRPVVQWFNRWIHPWIRRANGVYALGCLLLTQGVQNVWYQLPASAVEAFCSSQFWPQQFPRWLIGNFMLFGIAWLLWKRPKIIPRVPYWGALIATLLFPFFLITLAPTLSYLASSYNAQNLEVVRHVEKKFPDVQAQWKQNVALDQTRPTESIFTFDIEDRKFFQFSSWERVVLDGFGYANFVFDFIGGQGWGMTLSGLVISLMGIYVQHRQQALQLFHKDVRAVVPITALLLGIIVVYLISVNVANHQIAAEMGQGHYGQVVSRSQQLSRFYPPLRGDEDFLRRWAIASVEIDRPNEALVAFSKGGDCYRAGDFLRAKSYLEQALSLDPHLFLARGYLAATWVNEGVEYSKDTDRPKLPVYSIPFPKKNNFLDSPQSNERPNVLRAAGAATKFEAALAIFPDHIAALYDLMLMRVMNGEFEASAEVADRHLEVQNHFQSKNVALLGQAYLHKAWADYHAEDMNAAWRRYRQARDAKTWGDQIERADGFADSFADNYSDTYPNDHLDGYSDGQ